MIEDNKLDKDLRSLYSGVPEIVHQRVEDTLSALSCEQKPRKRKVLFWLPVASVGLIFLCVFALGFVSPTMAQYLERLPLVGIAFKHAGDPGIQNYSSNDSLGLTATDQDIPVTIDQVVYDGIRLSIGLIHDSNIEISLDPSKRSLTIDGQEINMSGGSVSKEINDEESVTVYHMMPQEKLPDSFQISLSINEVTRTGIDQSEAVKGFWNFQFQVDKLLEELFVQSFNPPLVKSYEGTTIEITEVMLTPITTKIAFNLLESEKYQKHSLRESQPNEFIRNSLIFGLLDERGVQRQPLSQGGGGIAGEPKQFEALFEPIAYPSNKITFQTFEESLHLINKGDGIYSSAEPPVVVRADVPQSFPFTVTQGDVGEITFHRIEFNTDKTLVTFSVNGSRPHIQDGAWWIEDEAGNKYDFDRYDQMRLNDNPFTYEVTLPAINPKANLQLVVTQLKSLKMLKELEFVIPLE